MNVFTKLTNLGYLDNITSVINAFSVMWTCCANKRDHTV